MKKKIHQIWLQGEDDIPAKYKFNINETIRLNPDWEYKLWDDDSLEKECMKYGKKCFERYISYKHLHQKVDLGRYVVLYNEGGISVDMDARALKSFNNIPHLYENKLIVSKLDVSPFWCYLLCLRGEICNNAHIYSPKNNKSLKKIIDGIVSREIISTTKEIDIVCTTGPSTFTKYVDDDTILIDYRYFEPLSTGGTNIFDDSIILHETDNTWVSGPFSVLCDLYKSDVITLITIIVILSVVMYSMTPPRLSV